MKKHTIDYKRFLLNVYNKGQETIRVVISNDKERFFNKKIAPGKMRADAYNCYNDSEIYIRVGKEKEAYSQIVRKEEFITQVLHTDKDTRPRGNISVPRAVVEINIT